MVDYSNIPRDSRRVPLATKVQFKFDRFSGFISEYSANISPTGMFIVSSNPEPQGRILELEFRLGDGFEIIQGQGEVVWSRSVADGPLRPPGMGIRFLDLSEGSKDLIYRIVDRYVQEGGTPFDLTSARDRGPDEPESLDSPMPQATAFPDLPPLELDNNPFPDLDLEPVKDSSGNALPWFAAGEAPSAPSAIPPGSSGSPAPSNLDEPFELFPSIGSALEEVEQTFSGSAAGRGLPREEPPSPAPAPVPMAAPAPPAPAPLLFPSAAPAPLRPERLAVAPTPLPPFATEEPAQPEPVDPFAAFAPGAPAPPPPEPPPSGPGLFADYLPKTAQRQEAPARKPLTSLAGSAAAQEPRRVFPWVLLAVLAVLGLAAFLFRNEIPGWLGIGGDEEVASAQAPQRPLHRRAQPAQPSQPSDTPPPVVQDLTPGSASATSAGAPEPPRPVLSPTPAPTSAPTLAPARQAPPEALPEAVQRKPAPAPLQPPSAPAGGPIVTAIERITFEQSLGGTDVVLWGNGAIGPQSYDSSRMEGPPRALIVVSGIRKPFAQTKINVGTGEVKQVRIGYHDNGKLHVVLDLAAPNVKVTRVDQDGLRLRIHLQKG
jgi:uncharacterized protein (TIGR02266 family)